MSGWKWFYIDNDGKEQGPVTGKQLGVLVKQGKIPLKTVFEDTKFFHPKCRDRRTLLHVAVLDENMEFVKWLVSQGADVNAKQKNGDTPLHEAVHYNEGIAIVKFLVSKGADVHAKGVCGWTPLFYTNGSDIEFAKFLVSKGADVNAKGEYDSTTLHVAVSATVASEEKMKYLKFLVSKGADVNAKDKKGYTPLHLAARLNEDITIAKFLVSQGADIHAKDKYGKTPLDMAKKEKNKAVVEYLSGIK